MRAYGVLVFLGTLGLAAPAHAASDFHLSVEGKTDFPIDVGGGLALELPGRIQLSGDVGVLPGAYVDAANTTLEGLNVYDGRTGVVVREALTNSLLLRGHLGWRPFASSGFFIQAGYGVAQLGGTVNAGDLSLATGYAIPPGVGALNALDISSTVELVDAQLGWRWKLDRLLVRAAVGGAHSVGSQSQLSIHNGGALDALAAPLEQAGAQLLDSKIGQYGNTVEVTLGLGFEAI